MYVFHWNKSKSKDSFSRLYESQKLLKENLRSLRKKHAIGVEVSSARKKYVFKSKYFFYKSSLWNADIGFM